MNILYLCDEYPPGRHGGIGSVVQLMARTMVAMGHNVVVAGLYDWGYGGEDYFDDNGVKVYRYRMNLASEWFKKQDSIRVRATYKLMKLSRVLQVDIKKSLSKYKDNIEALISEHDIDVIEMPDYHDYRRFASSYISPLVFSVPTVVKIHGSLTYIAKENNREVPKHIWQMEHDMFERATAVCSVSKYGGRKIMNYLELNRDVKVLYNGIDTDKLHDATEKDDNKVVFTGTLNENKGIYQLLEAWNTVHKRNKKVQLWIYGKGPIQKLKAILDEQARATVHFQGHIPGEQLFNELGTAAICVFPSYAENFALGPMEAMGSGAAVIYTKRTSGPELIDDGKDGMLIDPDNTNEIANCILELLNGKEKRLSIAQAGKKKIVDQFDIKVVAQNHIHYYKEVLSR